MTGWRLAVGLALAVGGGYVIASWGWLIRYDHLRARLLIAEANQNHALCKVAENAMRNYIAWQEARIDALEQGPGAVVEAAERIKRGEM